MSDISQGSVATDMRCGGIFSDNVTTNFQACCRASKSSTVIPSEYYQMLSLNSEVNT